METQRRVKRMHRLYETGASLEEVGERFGLSRPQVSSLFRQAGLTTRATGPQRRERALGRGSSTPRRLGPGYWTQERVVAAIGAWVATYGEPPTARDWNP